MEIKKKTLIKEGYGSDDINDIFKQNPQLGLIGTPQEYAKYLKTLFPSSKYKDIYYHQSKEMFDVYDFSKRKAYSSDLGKGLYLSKDKEEWKQYASGHRGTSFNNPVNTLYFKVNLINPHVTRGFYSERMDYKGKKDYVDVVRRTNDGIVEIKDRDDFYKKIPKYVFQMVVFDSKNYLRLGSKQDTINFQKFLGKNKYSENEIENLIKQYNPTLNTSKVFMGSFETDVLYKGMKTKERLNKNPILKNKVFAILGLTDNDDEKAKRKGIEIYAKYLLAYPNGNLNGFEKFIKSNHEFLDTPSIVDAEWNQQFEGFEIKKKYLIKENKNNVIYTAVFFNTNEVVSKYKQVHPNLYSHHSTIEFKPTDISNLPIGEEINIKVIGRLTNDKVDVLVVRNPLSKNKFPHITLSTAEGIKPFQSNVEIENNQDKIKPINDNLIGIVGYFDGSEKTQLEEMEVSKKDLIQNWMNNPKKLKEDAEDANFMFEITKGELEEEKKKADRCLRIARRKMPQTSAYRSGLIVQCRRGKIWKKGK